MAAFLSLHKDQGKEQLLVGFKASGCVQGRGNLYPPGPVVLSVGCSAEKVMWKTQPQVWTFACLKRPAFLLISMLVAVRVSFTGRTKKNILNI